MQSIKKIHYSPHRNGWEQFHYKRCSVIYSRTLHWIIWQDGMKSCVKITQVWFLPVVSGFRGTKKAEINLCLQAITYVTINFHLEQQSRAFYCVRYSMISVRFWTAGMLGVRILSYPFTSSPWSSMKSKKLSSLHKLMLWRTHATMTINF